MPSPSVLIVEDSAEDVALIRSALEKFVPKDQIIVAENGEKALDYLLARRERPPRAAQPLPRIVLLEMNLPGRGGLAVLRRIRAEPAIRLLPVIVLSATVARSDVRRSMEAGANSHVRKSLDHARLTDDIGLIARYWLELNIGPPEPAIYP